MAQLTIQLLPGPAGQLLVRVSLESAEDATPSEHEQDHRRLVGALLPGVDLECGDPSRVSVERERPQREPSVGCCGGDGGYEVIDLG
jgi:hypothetical protein